MGRKLLAVISILLTIAIFMPFANATSGRCIDIFTRRGGKGPGEPGGAFRPFELVQVYANVTYNEWPVQNVLVAFEVHDANGDMYLLLTNATDENGIAYIRFRIPDESVSGSVGTWYVLSTVDIAGEVVSDDLTFEVSTDIWVLTLSLKDGEETVWTYEVVEEEAGNFTLTVPEGLYNQMIEKYGTSEFIAPFDVNLTEYVLHGESLPASVLTIFEAMNPGDVNNDGKVDICDVAVVCVAYGSYPGLDNYNLFADVKFDFKIDICDVVLVCVNYGKTY